MFVHVYESAHLRMHLHTHICAYVHIYIHIHTYACMHMHILYTYTHTVFYVAEAAGPGVLSAGDLSAAGNSRAAKSHFVSRKKLKPHLL